MTVKTRNDAATRIDEIEAVLRGLPQVQDAVVRVRKRERGGREVVAYVVPSGPFDPQRLRAELASRPPHGVTPAAFVAMSSLPLTPAGQVDEGILAAIGVIESGEVSDLEERLRLMPGIDQVAVVVEEDIETVPPHHLSDLLPGWKSESAPEAGAPQAAPAQVGGAITDAGSGVPAISHGRPLRQDADAPATLPHALKRAARVSPERGVVHIEPNGTEIFQSYPALLEEAERILAGLRKLGLKPQDKVILQLERNQDFIPAFWGCQLGGFVPVPVSIAPTYASVNSSVSKLLGAWQLLGEPIILTDTRLAPAIRSLPGSLDPADLRIATIDELRRCEVDQDWNESRPNDLAILLLTSGSTGLPKAVMQSHRSLLSQSAGTSQTNGFSSAEVSLNWMPLDHVGGIVMFHVRDVYLGCRQIHVPTELILQEPLKWLDLIARFRATLTWAPNFAFGLVNAKEPVIRERRWDLSSMQFILNGGEAIVAKTARRFLHLLQPHGLPGTCMHPAWGMSETCSGVTYSDGFTEDSTSDGDSFVEVGAPIPGFSMRIVDARNQVTLEGKIGRLQVKGDSVTSGYYRDMERTQQAFSSDGWFETGDLGFLRRGRLTITGREKDTIIVNGVNYHSHEIEAVVEDVSGVVVSFTAACPIRGSTTDTDKVAIFFHPFCDDDATLSELLKAIRENVVKRIGINPDYLVPVEESDIPKTTIGKIQHAQLSQRFRGGEFDSVLKRVDVLSGNANTVPAWFYRKIWRRKEHAAQREQEKLQPTLVFADRSGLGTVLCDEMYRRGWPSVRVETGAGFTKLASNRYRIDPRDPEDYRRLLASVAADGVRIGQILHLWTYGAPAAEIASAEQLERSQDRGVYSLLFLVQALGRQPEDSNPIRLLVLSSNSQAVLEDDGIEYGNGSVFGFLKTVPQEMPWLDCRHLDLPINDAGRNVARVLDEVRTAVRDQEVAFRHGERWVPRLQRVNFTHEEQRELPFRRGGMYLLSGGLGGIGVEVARCLLQQYEARLLLVGRTPLAPAGARSVDAQLANVADHIKAFRELEQLPGEIHYESVDIGDLEGLQQAVGRARSRWNCDLDGVIHLAGIYHQKLLADETRESFARVLHPKVFGAWNLSRLLEDKPGSVFISFSSLRGQFGGALIGAYSAANSFLEAFTHFRRNIVSARSYCLEWSTWDELGMSRGHSMKELTRSRGYFAISRRQGLNSFLAALCRDEALVLVGLDGNSAQVRRQADAGLYRMQKTCAYFTTRANGAPIEQLQTLSIRDRFGTQIGCEFRRMRQLPLTDAGGIDREKLARLRQRGDRPAKERIAPRTDLERRIAGFWQEVLATPQVSVDDNFFELGGNSLLAMQVASRIEEACQIRLPLRTMLEESTVAKLALTVQRHLAQAPATSAGAIGRAMAMDAKRTLERLDQLSDEEVSALLSHALAHDEKR